jgi:hypothetical protein
MSMPSIRTRCYGHRALLTRGERGAKELLLITVVGIVVVLFGAYLTLAYLTQAGEASFAGVQVTLPFGVIVMIVGVAVIVFPWTPLFEGADGSPTTTSVLPGTSPVSTSPPTTISKEQEESRETRLVSVVPDQGIRATCSRTADAHFAGALMVMDCPTPGLVTLRLGLFPDSAAMYEVYNRSNEAAGVARDSGIENCESQPGEGGWSVEGTTLGRLVCHVDDDGRVRFEWTYDRVNVLAYGYRGDDNFAAMHRWWLNF